MGPRLALAAALVTALVLAGGVQGRAVVGPDVRLIAIRAVLDQVGARLELMSAALLEIESRASGIAVQLGEVRDAITVAERRLGAFEEVRERRRSLAAGVVETGHVPGRPAVPETLADLRAPLVAVSKAMRANDRLGIELLAERAAGERRLEEIRALLSGLREAAFRLGEQESASRVELAEAIRSASALGAASGVPGLQEQAEALVARARDGLHRIDLAREEIRAREREVLGEAARLRERLARIREDLRGVRRAHGELTRDMVVAELLVATWLGSFTGPLGEAEVALDGVLRVCPVDQPMSYSDNWHAPRWSGGFHLHQGIDIFAPPGTPIRAPFDGVAVTADNELGGIAVKVYGETGYVYNAHLSAYGTLGEVRAGDVIGYVGSTGNASGPHDHFEYHPLGGEAVNPFAFLNAVC